MIFMIYFRQENGKLWEEVLEISPQKGWYHVEDVSFLITSGMFLAQGMSLLQKPHLWEKYNSSYFAIKLMVRTDLKKEYYSPLFLGFDGTTLITCGIPIQSLSQLLDESLPFGNFCEGILLIIQRVLDQSADILEIEAGDVDKIGHQMFPEKLFNSSIRNDFLKKTVATLGESGHHLMKIQQSLESVERFVDLLLQDKESLHLLEGNDNFYQQLQNLDAEIQSQQNLAGYLVQNLAYLTDAAVGLIGVSQNNLMMFLSVLATIFIPPGLIVAIFGINFEGIPHISWVFGFALMFGAMIISSLCTYLLLKRHHD